MCSLEISPIQFWNAIGIYIRNTHTVNRRFAGVVLKYCWKIYKNTDISTISENIKNLSNDIFILNENTIINTIMNNYNSEYFSLSNEEFVNEISILDFDNNDFFYVILHKLIPKSLKNYNLYRFSLLDIRNLTATFYIISDNISLKHNFSPYSLNLVSNKISAEFISGEDSLECLKKIVPRIEKWATLINLNNKSTLNESLKLISLTEYNILYQELKIKYGQNLIKIWPENTDPYKFVYEDIAIATYLLLLWKNERQKNSNDALQSFVDLGCGNGLLVYILNEEGHPGIGIDVRRRRIWDFYPNHIILKEHPINPVDINVNYCVDWLIGNHSDELTPWIPVLAARENYNSRFFLLPCCTYEFNGKKYQRKNSSKSQYIEYLEYMENICSKCGIKTEIDRLKIPSTKRICLVGMERMYNYIDHLQHVNNLNNYIENILKLDKNSVERVNSQTPLDFNYKIRDPVEKVRNCTKIEKSLTNEIISTITAFLLNVENYDSKNWNLGGVISISEVSKIITKEQLKCLKNEFGGLQTLLKNHRNIFEVHSGNVKLRYPETKLQRQINFSKSSKKPKIKKKDINFKTKPCWFFIHHPDSCPLSAEDCGYSHNVN